MKKLIGYCLVLMCVGILSACNSSGGGGGGNPQADETDENGTGGGDNDTAADGSWRDVGESVPAGTLSRSRLVVDDGGRLYSLFMTSNGVFHLYSAQSSCTEQPCWSGLLLEEQQAIDSLGLGPGAYSSGESIPLIGLDSGAALSFHYPNEETGANERRVIRYDGEWAVLTENLALTDGDNWLGSVHATRSDDALFFATANECGIKLHRFVDAGVTLFDGPGGYRGEGLYCAGQDGPQSWAIAAAAEHLYVAYTDDHSIVVTKAAYDAMAEGRAIDWSVVTVLSIEDNALLRLAGFRLAAHEDDLYLLRRLGQFNPEPPSNNDNYYTYNAALFQLSGSAFNQVGGIIAEDHAVGLFYFDLHVDAEGRPLVAWSESFTPYYYSTREMTLDDEVDRLYFERLENGRWQRLGGGDIEAYGNGISTYVASTVHGNTPYIQFRGNAVTGTTGRDLRVMRFVEE